MSHGGDELRHRYAYVITLDAVTFLPPGAARQLVGLCFTRFCGVAWA
jgi:hypothetical protein